MPVVPMKELLDRALADCYGVAATTILNDLTIEAVLAAAVEESAPVILQTSVTTVRMYGRDQLFGIFGALVRDVPVPVALHLDHCPDRTVISSCLDGGWNSVLFDAHELDVAENLRQTTEVVAEARRHGAHVEGEIEGIQGVEDGVGSDHAPGRPDAGGRGRPHRAHRRGLLRPPPSPTRTVSTRPPPPSTTSG